MSAHIVNGKFQSDKYPTCPAGKVPLSTSDPMAQDLLEEYARRRALVDVEFSHDLVACLRADGYTPPPLTSSREAMFSRAAEVLRGRAEHGRQEANSTHGIAPWPESHKKKLRERADMDEAFAIVLELLPWTFEEAWAKMEARGFQYGGDALENVRFGWDLATGKEPANWDAK